MKFQNIKPFVRFVRYLEYANSPAFQSVVPLDCRIFAVVEGIGKIEVDGEYHELRQGSVMFINSGVTYTLLPAKVKYEAVNFDFCQSRADLEKPIPPVALLNFSKFDLVEHFEFEDAPEFDRFAVISGASDITDAISELEEEYVKGAIYSNQLLCARLTDILISLLRKIRNPAVSGDRFDPDKIAAYIHRHFAENIDNSTLAQRFHFHPNYISNEFRRHFGKPLHRYLLEVRILNAVALMESGNKNIAQIALEVGFADPNYFTRYFKQIMGATPKAYLQQNKTEG